MNVGDLENYEKDHISFNQRSFNESITLKPILREQGIKKKSYRSHESIIGKVGLMCPHCFNYIIRNVNINCNIMIENNDPTKKADPELWVANDFRFMYRECQSCHEWDVEMIVVDVNLVEAISQLNKKGFKTRFCCEGHVNPSTNAYILFEDDSIIKYLNTLPITWYFDMDANKNFEHICIRSDAQDYAEGMMDIKEWVDSLPVRSTEVLFEVNKPNKNYRVYADDIIHDEKIIQELKDFAKKYELNIADTLPRELLNCELDTMKGFQIGESVIQNPSNVITFKPHKNPDTRTISHVLEKMKERPNAAVYGALAVYGKFNDNQ